MVKYKLVYTKQAKKDAKKLNQSGLKTKTLLDITKNNPLLYFSNNITRKFEQD